MALPDSLKLRAKEEDTKFLARLWKDLVFAAAGASVDLGYQFSQGEDLRPYLVGILRKEERQR